MLCIVGGGLTWIGMDGVIAMPQPLWIADQVRNDVVGVPGRVDTALKPV